ncbi:MAG: O-antigen ligase family protein [Ignavibacteria bacterium]
MLNYITRKDRYSINALLNLSIYLFFLIVAAALSGRSSSYVILIGVLAPIIIFIINLDLKISVFFYIALIPIIQHYSYIGPNLGDFVISPHMMIQFIIILFVFADFLYNYNDKGRKFNLIDKLLLAFVLFSIFSLIFPYYLPLNHTKRWLLFYTGVFENISFYFIITYLLYRNPAEIQKILFALLCTSFSSLIIALLEIKFLGFNPVKIFLARMSIGFGYHNTNLFGIHSVVLFPIIFYLLVNKSYKRLKVLSWGSFVILSVLSILCFNRGTFIVLFFQLLLLFLIKENRKIIYGFVLSFAILVLYFSNIIFLYVYRFIGEFGFSNGTVLDESAYYRLEAWKTGLKTLLLYPLGIGAGGFQYIWEKYGSDPSFFLGTPHHLFLSIGVDYGVIPMLIFIIILIISYLYCSRINKSTGQVIFRYIKISIVGFVLYGLITDGELSHLTGSVNPNNGYNIFFFTLVAIISVNVSRIDNDRSR